MYFQMINVRSSSLFIGLPIIYCTSLTVFTTVIPCPRFVFSPGFIIQVFSATRCFLFIFSYMSSSSSDSVTSSSDSSLSLFCLAASLFSYWYYFMASYMVTSAQRRLYSSWLNKLLNFLNSGSLMPWVVWKVKGRTLKGSYPIESQ